ncbi:MAG: peptidoglycan-binding protein [Ignavibacteriae bacterium HGW-Ignavibacteriae-2]|jgi:hypothetical protein|nr:MAG: peptidoglycan-binding protein [Ignavibacteriae bacterium HGW-Ignavibacteriae-2]
MLVMQRLSLINIIVLFFFVVMLNTNISLAQGWQSEIVHYDDNGKLVYVKDIEGNRIPDFSFVGYKNGNDTIPYVPVVKTISPISGDNTSHINSAILELAAIPLNSAGIRGALLLEPGIYEVKNIIYIQFDGIILRGSGDGSDPSANTIIYATSTSQKHVIRAGGGSESKWSNQTAGSKTNIVSDSVLVGENEFEVEDVSSYKVGDNIIIYHPCTEEWLKSIDYGGTHPTESGAEPGIDIPWTVDEQPLIFNRFITAIDGNKITIDVPVYNHLIRSLSQSYIYKFTRTGIRTNIGIENLRVDIKTKNLTTDEDHAEDAINIIQAEDCWVRNCTALHFTVSGFKTATATRITIENCKALDPVSEITGGNRYNFNTYTASQQILFKDCSATNGRHHYVSNGMSWTSGVVFYNCTSSGAYTSSEGHRRWSMGFLWDNHTELDGPRAGVNPRLLGLYNRGHYGTSHGWSIANSVAWNCDVKNGELIVQKPPTAQNYGIGCTGKKIAGSGEATFNEPAGYIEGSNTPGLNPQSLYMAQLADRQNAVVSVDQKTDGLAGPNDFRVYNNYPNPFNPSTNLLFDLPKMSKVNVTVVDILGNKIFTIKNLNGHIGFNTVLWNGEDNNAMPVNSGVYIYMIETDFGIKCGKMLLLK